MRASGSTADVETEYNPIIALAWQSWRSGWNEHRMRVALRSLAGTALSTEHCLAAAWAVGDADLPDALAARLDRLHWMLLEAQPEELVRRFYWAILAQRWLVRAARGGEDADQQALLRAREALAESSRLPGHVSEVGAALLKEWAALAPQLYEAGWLEESRVACEVAIERFRALADGDAAPPGLAMSLANLANVLATSGDFDRAYAAAEEAAELYRAAALADGRYLPALAMTLVNLGRALSGARNFDRACAAFEEAADYLRRLAGEAPETFLPLLATALNNLGGSNRERYALDAALLAVDEGLAIRRTLADAQSHFRPELAESLNERGNILVSQRDFAKAIDAYEEAIAVYREPSVASSEVLSDLAMTLTNLANALADRHDLSAAVVAYREALAIRRHLASQPIAAYQADLARTLAYLGTALLQQRAFAGAIASSAEAVAIFRSLAAAQPDAYAFFLALALGALADARVGGGEAAGAVEAAEEAVHHFRTLAAGDAAANSPHLAKALTALSRSYAARGDVTSASAALAEAELMFRDLSLVQPMIYVADVAMALVARADLLLRAGDSGAALELYGKAGAVLVRHPASGLANRPDIVAVEWRLLAGQGRASDDLSRRRDAFARALALVESQQARLRARADRLALQGEYHELYREMVACCLALARAEPARGEAYTVEAWQWTERGRARALLDLLDQPRPRLTTEEERRRYADWEQAQRTVERCWSALHGYLATVAPPTTAGTGTRALPASDTRGFDARARRLWEALQDADREEEERYHRLHATSAAVREVAPLAMPAPDALRAHYRRLSAGARSGAITRALLIEYALLPSDGVVDRYAVFFVPLWEEVAASVFVREIALPLGTLAALAADFAAVRDASSLGGASAPERANRETDETLWASLPAALGAHLVRPWEEVLAELAPTSLILVTEGSLQGFPLHAVALTDGEPLIARYPVVVLPLAALLERLATRDTQDSEERARLVLGPHTLDPAAAGYLSHAAGEALTLAKRWGLPLRAGRPPYAAADMRVDVLRAHAGKLAILHLATHSHFEPSDYRRSHIVFHGDERLFVSTILSDSRIDLQGTRLCYLSSCSGMRVGNEVAGLAYALFFAGAEAVQASLWNVDDQSAAYLALMFYKRWARRDSANPDPTLAEAYREAVLAVREVFPHPRHWAPFVLLGNGCAMAPLDAPARRVG